MVLQGRRQTKQIGGTASGPLEQADSFIGIINKSFPACRAPGRDCWLAWVREINRPRAVAPRRSRNGEAERDGCRHYLFFPLSAEVTILTHSLDLETEQVTAGSLPSSSSTDMSRSSSCKLAASLPPSSSSFSSSSRCSSQMVEGPAIATRFAPGWYPRP